MRPTSRLAAAALTLALAAAPVALAAPTAGPPAWKEGDTVVVRREGVRLMRGPRFYGKPCPEVVVPGRQVKIAERQRGWARIAAPGAGRCWLHETAWSDRAPGELAGAAAPAASQRDVELAGRGFSEQEEERFRGEHGDLDAAFAAVEDHLARGPEPGPEELTRFAKEGGLGGDR
jgi:hypothetical protein